MRLRHARSPHRAALTRSLGQTGTGEGPDAAGTIPSAAAGTSRDLIEPKSQALPFNLVPATPADGEQLLRVCWGFNKNSAPI